jgi:hypothetical protein
VTFFNLSRLSALIVSVTIGCVEFGCGKKGRRVQLLPCNIQKFVEAAGVDLLFFLLSFSITLQNRGSRPRADRLPRRPAAIPFGYLRRSQRLLPDLDGHPQINFATATELIPERRLTLRE